MLLQACAEKHREIVSCHFWSEHEGGESFSSSAEMLPGILLFLGSFIRSSLPRTAPRSREERAAALEKLPWKVSIEAINKHICGGVILNSWWILSAAHCFTKDIPPDIQIIVGLTGHPERRTLDRIVIHQDFNSESMAYDIALILLDSPVKFTEENTFISLPFMHDLHMWKDCRVTRWNSSMAAVFLPSGSAGGEKKPLQMQEEVEATLISNKECSESIQGLTEDVLCAVPVEGSSDICEGDSGGPLVCTNGDIVVKWFVVGISSQGDSCRRETSPAAYTLVFNYLDWIQTATAREGKPYIPKGMDIIGTSAHAGAGERPFAFHPPLLPLVCLILMAYES
ncbi:trypsin-like isoform X2 [Paroedura picta]|uniref:trypsin-like isoform X2 n=1 Tax=Paroedura picta TaxID=143630 RepID=UPI004055E834